MAPNYDNRQPHIGGLDPMCCFVYREIGKEIERGGCDEKFGGQLLRNYWVFTIHSNKIGIEDEQIAFVAT